MPDHPFVVLAVIVTENADGVNRGIRLLGHLHRVLKCFAAGVVVAVGDHEQHALVLVPLLQMVERTDHGVVERRAAARIDSRERFIQFLLIAREILVQVQIILVVEIHHERFVLRIAGLNERERCVVHLRALLAHAAAIVDYQAHRHRNVFAGEDAKSSAPPCPRTRENCPVSGPQRTRPSRRPRWRAAPPDRRSL